MSRHNVLIVGGGPAGYTAALYAARAGLSALVYEKLSPGGQMATTTRIENYPGLGEGVEGWELAEKMRAGAENAGAKTIFAEATSFDLKSSPKRVCTSEGCLEADAVILATGAYPRELGLAGERELRGRGVSYCAACDGMFFRKKTVTVVGGGDSAAADALTLARLCEKVYLIHRRNELRAAKSYIKSIESASNIELILNAEPVELLQDGQLQSVAVADKLSGERRVLECSGLFVAVGRVPDTALISGQVALDAQGYIIAGEDTQTNLPGVFAAGDARTKPVRQIITAASDGATAAKMAEEYISRG